MVLATHTIRQFPLHFRSRTSPCAITFQLESNNISNFYLQYNYWTVKLIKNITFGVLTSVNIHSTVFWIMTPCSLVDWYQGLLRIHCLVRVQYISPSLVTKQHRVTIYRRLQYAERRRQLWLSDPYTDVCMYVCPLRVRVEVLAYTWPLRKLTGYPLLSGNNHLPYTGRLLTACIERISHCHKTKRGRQTWMASESKIDKLASTTKYTCVFFYAATASVLLKKTSQFQGFT